MSESEWAGCCDPAPMLHFVRLRASPRQLRLFCCACCRLVWDALPGDWSREAVELGERLADNTLDEEAREHAYRHTNSCLSTLTGSAARLGQAAVHLLRPKLSPVQIAQLARTGPEAHLLPSRECDLLRDILGSPFRRSTLPAGVRAAHGGAVERVARAIYEERRFEDLPLLAGALEDAGCEDAGLLEHCRGAGPHVLGCWAVDLALDHIV